MDENEQRTLFDKDAIRHSTDAMTDRIDEQAIENIKTLQAQQNYKEELIASLNKLNSHSICPSSLPTCESSAYEKPAEPQSKEEHVELIHGDDCHCSKCCPNPNPNFFQKHKMGLLVGVLWMALIVLGVGWTPSGGVFDAIQNSWVELFVNFFKMGIFAIAGIVTYQLMKKGDA